MPICAQRDDYFTQTELAVHLAVNRSSVVQVAQQCGLIVEYGRYPWRRILRHIHGVDPTQLEALAERLSSEPLQLNLGDINHQLREPLLTFEQVAHGLGYRPDTLSKAVRQGRIELPLPKLLLGPRLRRFRPLDLRVWKEFGVAIPYPVPATQTKSATELKPAGSANLAPFPEAAVALVFGAFGKK